MAVEEAIVEELVLLIQISGIKKCNCMATISHQLKKMLAAHKCVNPDTSIYEIVYDWQDFIDIKIGERIISLTIDDVKKLSMISTT
jgi:hypothetical protein